MQKIVALFLLSVLLQRPSLAQTNLVPNPRFRYTIRCPLILTQIEWCTYWFNFGNTPDCFNACSPTGTNVPNNSFGYQDALYS